MNTHRDAGNRQRVSAEEVQRLRRLPGRHSTGGRLSARNRLAGRVASVEADGVMALVEIQVGTDRITAAITRDSVEELGLLESQRVFVRVKADRRDGGTRGGTADVGRFDRLVASLSNTSVDVGAPSALTPISISRGARDRTRLLQLLHATLGRHNNATALDGHRRPRPRGRADDVAVTRSATGALVHRSCDPPQRASGSIAPLS